MTGRRLGRAFFARDPLVVAPDLLGATVRSSVGAAETSGRIVEVEAYRGADDPGSHGHRGPTPRSTVMFGPPGHLYVYFSYGMHWCTNIVCGPEGTCGAVLVRALTPLTGLDTMRDRRPAARRDRDLCSGPAKLSAALGLEGTLDGADLTHPEALVWLEGRDTVQPTIATSRRIGLSPGRGEDLRWRWYLPGVVDVSARPR